MDKNIFEDYLMITGGNVPSSYKGAEAQGKEFQKCSILKEVNLEYSNSTDNKVRIE